MASTTRRSGPLWYAQEIAGCDFRAVHVPGHSTEAAIEAHWRQWAGDRPPLELLPSGEGRVESLLEFVWSVPRSEADFVNVVVPELFHKRSLFEAARRLTSLRLKLRLLKEPGVVITDVPLVAGELPVAERAVGRVLVSGVHGASLRAIAYAETLQLDDVRGVFFAFDADEARRMRQDWERFGVRLPLDIVEAPFRDLGDPLRTYLRQITRPTRSPSSSCRSSSSTAGTGCSTTSARSTSSGCCSSSRNVILSSVPYRLG